MIKNILESVDESEYTDRNIKYTCALVKFFKAKLTLIHVVSLPTTVAPEAYLDPKPFLDAGEKFLEEVKQKVKDLGVKASTHIEFAYGNPAHKVVEYAKKGNFDLIAIGAKGESRIKSLLLGSVAETVARDAPCPVIIIR